MATYLELKAQAEALMKQAEEVRKKEIAEIIAEIKTKIQEYGITAADLGLGMAGKRASKRAGSSSAAVVRYRGPEGQEWSGMGRQPAWIKQAIAEGKSKEDFAV